MSDLIPDDYTATLEELKRQVHEARLRVQRKANTELLQLWWQIGRTIIDRQAEQGWGSKVLDRLAADLRAEFPSMKGFSRRNLLYMRAFAGAWPDATEIVQRPIAQLPWGHVIELLDKLDDQETRNWYAAKDAHHQWSRPMLAHQITTRLHEREAAAPSNFAGALERLDSDQAQELTKDPYALEFLAVDGDASERELEQRMVDRILDTMRELGPGFAFVGRQVHFDIDGVRSARRRAARLLRRRRRRPASDPRQAPADRRHPARRWQERHCRSLRTRFNNPAGRGQPLRTRRRGTTSSPG